MEKENDFRNFGKNHEKEDHNSKVSTKKKKTTAMEFWKKTKNKKNIALGALEKSRKKKTMTSGVRLGRKKWLWELWKKP